MNIAGVTNNVLAKLPRMKTMHHDVRGQRATHTAHPPILDDGNTLFDILQRFMVTSTGDEFLKYDNQRADRILIFGTGRCLNFLHNSDNWFMDRTFLTVPPQFAQLYTLQGLSHSRHIVKVCGLLQNKRLNTYKEFLMQIRNLKFRAVYDGRIRSSLLHSSSEGLFVSFVQKCLQTCTR